MASYPHIINIQKINENTDIWEDYYNPHTLAKRTGGSKYEEAATNIGSVIYKFKVRYCKLLEDILFNYEKYRIIYKSNVFNIKSTDRFEENSNEIVILGEYNGNKN